MEMKEMQKFKVIESPARPKPDYPGIYASAMMKSMKKKPDPVTDAWTRRHVYLAVRGLPIMWNGLNESTLSEEETGSYFTLAASAADLISQLTPRKLTQIFPITKEYDGLKYGWKDYFTTIEELNKIGMDNVIGDRVEGLLWDYQNRHVRNFVVFKMSVVDRLRRYRGQPGMMEEFMSEQGVTPMRLMTTDTGRQVLYDPEKQTMFPVVKKKPRYLRVVK